MISDIIQQSIKVKENILLDKSLHKIIYNSIDVIVNAFQSGNKVMFCGNGGSAAGIGFTVAIFIANLAFDDAATQDIAVLAVIIASVVSALLSTVLFKTVAKR